MIKVNNISFEYSKGKLILDQLSFEVPKGSIYGFLGANGAGKTTTIRIILNLMTANSGSISVNGLSFDTQSIEIYKNIGSLIEQPTFYSHLSGRANLSIWANYYKVPKTRVDEVLEWVQLEHACDQKAKNYSQGMKQRLGIATALLHDPELLILDEPLNGLDPKGIAEMRQLFFRLKEKGKTIFLSSHILSEIEATCDRLCILDSGKLKFEGTVNELNRLLSKNIQYEIRCSKQEEALSTLLATNIAQHVELSGGTLRLDMKKEEEVAQIVKELVEQQFEVFEVKKKVDKLEDLYLKLTNPSA